MKVTQTVEVEVEAIDLDPDNPVASLREQLGLTYVELADTIGVSKQCVHNYGRYGQALGFSTLCKIVNGLGYELVLGVKRRRGTPRSITLDNADPVGSLRSKFKLTHAQVGGSDGPFAKQIGYRYSKGRRGQMRLSTLTKIVEGVGGQLKIRVEPKRRRKKAS